MDAYSSLRRTLKSAQEQESRDGAETKETELRRAAETAKGAKDRESGGGDIVPGALLKRPRRKKTTAVCATTLKQTSSEVYNWRYFIPHRESKLSLNFV